MSYKIDHQSTVIVVDNIPELFYVLKYAEICRKKIDPEMYKITTFPYCLSLSGDTVGWLDKMDRAVYYKPFLEFIKDVY